ncbi:MAG: hypothetical protein PUI85_02005 [Eubacteriales bacterium]|nr:hypothetical protein [Eubacteriales bacterium]MDY3332182.1 hypothetical protein [Gallibacter sp.]
MLCKKCGTQNDDALVFCKTCFSKLEKGEEAEEHVKEEAKEVKESEEAEEIIEETEGADDIEEPQTDKIKKQVSGLKKAFVELRNSNDLVSKLRLGYIAACALIIIGAILPFYTFFGITINFVYVAGTFADGILYIILAAIGIIFCLLKKPIINLIVSGLTFIIFLLGNVMSIMGYGSPRIGFFLWIIGVIGSIGLSIAIFIKGKEINS